MHGCRGLQIQEENVKFPGDEDIDCCEPPNVLSGNRT